MYQSNVSAFIDLAEASLLSGHNAVVLSKPGWGKSKILFEAARKSGLPFVFLNLSPSTPPERVEGTYDIAALREGHMVLRREGTAYDPEARIVILDELFRASDVVFDLLLDATSPVAHARCGRVFWATSNFTPAQKRAEALLDRFALWMWWSGAEMGVSEIAAQIERGLDVPAPRFWRDGLPNPRQFPAAMKMAVELAKELGEAAVFEGFEISPRRIEAWVEIAVRLSVFEAGGDTSKLGHMAERAMRYAYPCPTEEQFLKWGEITASVIRSDEYAIKAVLDNVLERFRELMRERSREDALARMGVILAETENDLARFGEAGAEAFNIVSGWFRRAARGEEI